jgi:4-amino-4-deoxy-L-arabinose transferase-like glycosyltransferase/putative flippase GtrA
MSVSTVEFERTGQLARRGLARFSRFIAIGLSGMVVNTLVLALAAEWLHLHYLVGAVVSTQVSTTWNYLLIDRLVYKQRGPQQRSLLRYLRFSAMNHAMLVVRGPAMVVLVELLGVHYLLANIMVLSALVVLRYKVADNVIWAPPTPSFRGSSALREDAFRLPSLPPEALEPPWPWRWRFVAFSSIAVPAVAVRVWHLNDVGFNSDEAVYAGQAASIAGDAALTPYFPIFRAHPLLFQTTLSLFYRFGTSPLVGRLLAAAFGLATVWACYLVGRELYGRRVGMVAAALLAVMPYHVVVTRQVLLDGPMTFFATISLFLLARFASTKNSIWLVAAGGALGLTFLAKETSIVLVGGAYAFFAMAPSVRVRLRALLLSMVGFVLAVLPFPLSITFSGKSSTGEAFLAWQLFRRPNHSWRFYPSVVPSQLGWLVLLTALAGGIMLWRQRTWRESLLLCWITVPIVFFQLWPVKGFQYLLPVAPVLAVLAGRALMAVPLPTLPRVKASVALRPAAVGVVALSLFVPTWRSVTAAPGTTRLAGAGGVPGGREAGAWVAANVPVGARLLAIGPSMANLMQFYGHRKSFGLSVSPNPLHRNPVYEPVPNADLQLRSSEIHYLVWDSFSADRSPFFAEKLMVFAKRYHGRVVHTESVEVDGVAQPVIVIYEVRP